MVLAACGAGREAAADGMRAIIDKSGAVGWRNNWIWQLPDGAALGMIAFCRFDTEEQRLVFRLSSMTRAPWRSVMRSPGDRLHAAS